MALEQMLLFPIDAPPVPVKVSPAKAKTGNVRITAKPATNVVPPAFVAPPVQGANTALVSPTPASSSSALPTKPNFEQLKRALQRLEGRHPTEAAAVSVYSSGGKVLDDLLPHRGLRPGTIVQWTGDRQSNGASLLSLLAAAEITRSEQSAGKPVVVFDFDSRFYPPAAISLGIPADRLIVIRKPAQPTGAVIKRGDWVWAIDQALRCDAVAAVWADVGTWLNERDARRLQLAAETGGSLGLFVRPTVVRGRPSFSDIHWHVTPITAAAGETAFARRLQVHLDRCRGGIEGGQASIEIKPSNEVGRAVAITALTSTTAIRSQVTQVQHERSVVSDLARRLAHPASAQRTASDERKRNPRRAS